jgi:hypothetical protein
MRVSEPSDRRNCRRWAKVLPADVADFGDVKVIAKFGDVLTI